MKKSNQCRILVISIIFLLSSSPLAVLDVNAQEENTWTTLTSMQVKRVDLGVAVVNEKIYAIGQGPNYSIDTVEEYDPQTDTWTYKNLHQNH